MTGQFSARVEATLRREADSIVDGPGFSGDDIVRAGRTAVARRRVIAVGTAAAAMVLVATGAYAALPHLGASGPDLPPAAPTVTPPGPSDPAPSPGVPPGDLGITVRVDNVVYLPDGEPVTLPVGGEDVWSVSRVPDGWVVETLSELWWVPDAGQHRLIGPLGAHLISADGRRLVAAATDGSQAVVAVALPSLDEMARTTFPTVLGPVPVGFVGPERVLLKGAQGAPGPSAAAVWDWAHGLSVVPTEDVWLWAGRDGYALRRVDVRGDGAKDIRDACLDLVEVTDSIPVGPTGLCGEPARAMFGGDLSPDGRWVHLYSGTPDFPGSFLLAAADLRAGRWQPVEVDPAAHHPLVWDATDSYLARGVDYDDGYYRCDTTGACARVSLPSGVGIDAAIVPGYGD